MPRRGIRFLADENIAPRVVQALRDFGYDVVLTHDRDFAHALFRPPAIHHGIVILRFSNQTPEFVKNQFLHILQPRVLKRIQRSVILVTDEAITIVH